MPPAKLRFLPALRQALLRVLLDRLQHPEALVRVADEALVDERLQRVEVGVRHLLCRLERATAAEDGQAGEELLLGSVEQLVRPLDRRPERLLARLGVPAALEQVEPLREPLEDLGGGRTLVLAAASSSASGSLSRRRQSSAIVSSGSSRERAQKSSTASGSASGGTGYSTSPRIRSSSRLVTSSARFGQASSSGESSGAASTTCSKLSSSKQQLALADVLGQAVLRAQRLRDRLDHERRVAQRRRAPTQKTPALNAGTSSAAASIASRVLPEPPGPESVTRRAPFRSSATHLVQLPLPADEGGGRPRQVRVRDRLQRREALVPSWKSATGSAKSFSRCSPRSVSSPSTSARVAAETHDLAAMPAGGDPRSPVDLPADISLPASGAAARVQAHPHPDRARRKRLLALQPPRQAPPAARRRRRRRRPPACPPRRRRGREGLAQQPAMLRQRLD